MNARGSYFPDWNPKTDKVVHVLLVIKKIFKTMHTRAEPCNRDAAHLLATDEEAFKTSVRDCVRESIENIYRSPPPLASLRARTRWVLS